jgi:hypothetical protein
MDPRFDILRNRLQTFYELLKERYTPDPHIDLETAENRARQAERKPL